MNIDPEDLRQIGAAAAGSGIAAWFARATGWDLALMFTGGCLTAIFIAPSIAMLANLSDHQTLVGFVVGFLAIMLLRKIRDVVENIPAKGVAGMIIGFFRRLGGLPPLPAEPSEKEQ